ncbi:hypothetical protein NQ315_000520 [Exocentrus adspersus]|uniref:Uncharacterized protein n=1 Tax=Exocentrus adspersus TaxID=1586481 RepID=A0AAV8VDD2_9CUCU|nr:hypothetical protein NQ315_000520 [Exocentrus adspersus]
MDFVTQFYNIQGDLISERKRNFSKLLKAQTVPLTEEDLKSLHPRTPLEGLFHIDILIHFKILKKLLDVIKGGNEVYISKIMKHPLLVKETIGYVSAESFVNEFLPCVSRAMRMKVVKKDNLGYVVNFCSICFEAVFWDALKIIAAYSIVTSQFYRENGLLRSALKHIEYAASHENSSTDMNCFDKFMYTEQ